MRFDRFITPEERVQAWSRGITYKLATSEILPSEFNGMCKKAQAGQPPLPIKAMLWLALLTGVPLGVGSSLINNELERSGKTNAALRKKRDYTRDVTETLRQRLKNQETDEESEEDE